MYGQPVAEEKSYVQLVAMSDMRNIITPWLTGF